MKRRWLLGLGVALNALATSLCASTAEKVTWNWALYGPPRAVTVCMEHLAKVAKERSGGNFVINLRYNEQLGDAKDMLDGLKVDAFQGAFTAYSYAPAKTPIQGVLDMPFLPIGDLVIQEKVQDEFQKWKPAADELARWNAMHLMTILLPQYEFMGPGTPPRSLEDWKGMRVRALGGLGDAMKLLGAVPTSVSAPEVYTGLERGTFQAASFPFAYSFTGYKLHEVSKCYTLGMHLGIVHNSLNLSIKAWEALPSEYKKILEDAKGEALRPLLRGSFFCQDEGIWLLKLSSVPARAHETQRSHLVIEVVLRAPALNCGPAERHCRPPRHTEEPRRATNHSSRSFSKSIALTAGTTGAAAGRAFIASPDDRPNGLMDSRLQRCQLLDGQFLESDLIRIVHVFSFRTA